MKKKTLLVGLDAACWEYVEPLLEAGRLPNLKKLIDNGTSGIMQSTMPPWTPTAWASIVTGKNPGKHGIFDMLWRPPGTYEFAPTSARDRVGTSFWKRLNEGGIRVGLVNVPFTHPIEPLDGFMVCGFGTPNSAKDTIYPEEAYQWAIQTYGKYEPAVEGKFLRTASPSKIFEKERSHQKTQVQLALEFAEHYEVEVLVINLMFTDHANHKMPELEQVYEAYEHSDSDLGRLIEGFRPDNVMLISDHGSNRLKGNFLLNSWLCDQGYYVQAKNTPTQQTQKLNWILVQWLQKHNNWSGPQEKVLRRLAREGILRLPNRIKEQFLDKIEETIPFARDHINFADQPNYFNTPVFPGSIYSGLLYLNVIDRETNGVISANEKKAIATEIAGKLRTVKEPDTGESLFTNVYTASEIYHGPFLEYAPDLIIDSYDNGWNIQTSKFVPTPEQTTNKYFVELGNQRDFGWHSRDGVFVFSGEDFKVEATTSMQGHVTDIAATLLHLYNRPIPDDYDGRVLTELMSDEMEKKPINFQSGDNEFTINQTDHSYSDEESEELVEHLRALGYLD